MRKAVTLIEAPISQYDKRCKIENLAAKELAQVGFCLGHLLLLSLRANDTLDNVKVSMTAAQPTNLSYLEVCDGVDFNKY